MEEKYLPIIEDYIEHLKSYKNVIINYQDKKITCSNFDINMEKNMAIAYNDVVITDPKPILKAGIVEFDLKTKKTVLFYNPEKTNVKLIEKAVSDLGYQANDLKANSTSYADLPDCCKIGGMDKL